MSAARLHEGRCIQCRAATAIQLGVDSDHCLAMAYVAFEQQHAQDKAAEHSNEGGGGQLVRTVLETHCVLLKNKGYRVGVVVA